VSKRGHTDNTADRQARHSTPGIAGADGPCCRRPARRGGQRRWRLGLIGGGYGDAKWLTREFEAAGVGRVGVGFITWSLAKRPALLDMALERCPAAVMLSFGDPAPFVERIKRAGATLICQVQTVAMAREAVAKGADMLVAQSAEAGGHGVARGTMALVPAIVDAVGPDLPVAAAGGIADGRGHTAESSARGQLRGSNDLRL
jgi:nitronate monooxygenase